MRGSSMFDKYHLDVTLLTNFWDSYKSVLYFWRWSYGEGKNELFVDTSFFFLSEQNISYFPVWSSFNTISVLYFFLEQSQFWLFSTILSWVSGIYKSVYKFSLSSWFLDFEKLRLFIGWKWKRWVTWFVLLSYWVFFLMCIKTDLF